MVLSIIAVTLQVLLIGSDKKVRFIWGSSQILVTCCARLGVGLGVLRGVGVGDGLHHPL